MTPKTDFKDLSFNISNYCIATCRYCTLWRPENWRLDEEMKLRYIEAFLADPILDGLVTIHLTGGEPYLSPKILPIVGLLYDYHQDVPINLPSNGLYPQLIYRIMSWVIRKLPQWRVNVNIEGSNKRIHELIRGRGSWKPVWETVRLLKSIGVNLVSNMSIYRENYRYIKETKELVESHGLKFYLNFGRFSRRFGNAKDAIMWYEETEPMIRKIEEQLNDIGWLKERRLNLQKWMIQKAFWRGQKVHFNCLAGIEGIDIYPNGDVYPCLIYPQDYRFGNIQEVPLKNPLTTIMGTEHSRRLQERIHRGDCSSTCPFTCQLRLRNLTIDGVKVEI